MIQSDITLSMNNHSNFHLTSCLKLEPKIIPVIPAILYRNSRAMFLKSWEDVTNKGFP